MQSWALKMLLVTEEIFVQYLFYIKGFPLSHMNILKGYPVLCGVKPDV